MCAAGCSESRGVVDFSPGFPSGSRAVVNIVVINPGIMFLEVWPESPAGQTEGMLSIYAAQLRPLFSIWSARFVQLTKQVGQSLVMPKVLPAVSARSLGRFD